MKDGTFPLDLPTKMSYNALRIVGQEKKTDLENKKRGIFEEKGRIRKKPTLGRNLKPLPIMLIWFSIRILSESNRFKSCTSQMTFTLSCPF